MKLIVLKSDIKENIIYHNIVEKIILKPKTICRHLVFFSKHKI